MIQSIERMWQQPQFRIFTRLFAVKEEKETLASHEKNIHEEKPDQKSVWKGLPMTPAPAVTV